ncbi:MAG: hypothetical protein HGA78_06340 [Nitrospirales bacterium]|nr:hypothetical protein [Nitrospirales bacterium]
MDFKIVFKELLAAFAGHDVRYALMGGFAMGLWGGARSTVDLDFLVHRDDVPKVESVMQGLGYECRYRSENVSQYLSPLRVFGEVDFLHAFRDASLGMLQRAVEKEVFGSLKIRVLIPEDIIGLKLQAIKNNPSRRQKDLEDIETLIDCQKERIDWVLIEQYAGILGMEDLYGELCKRK